jgi:hypothetical protein
MSCPTIAYDPNITQTAIRPGEWHKYEMYMKYATDSAAYNGILRVWVDGVLNIDVRNICSFGLPRGQVSAIMMCAMQGGQGTPKTENAYYWYDHVYVSTPHGAPIPPTITNVSLGFAQAGKPYTSVLQAAGGSLPYAWSVSSGSLLTGLTLNSTTGVISGTPVQSGSSTFTITVTDASQATAAKQFMLVASGTGVVGKGDQLTANREHLKVETKAGSVKFNLGFLEKGSYTVKVHNLSGQKVWGHAAAVSKAGTTEVEWRQAAGLKEGVYVARLQQGTKGVNARFCVAR